MNRPAGYVRLSREDVRKGERIEQHTGILRHLAEQHGVVLAEADIISEVESSATLDRAGLQRVLASLTTGDVDTLFVYDVSRLSRGSEDQWAEIKRALYRHQSTLVTPAGPYRFDNALDTTLLDIEAVLARRYRWEFGRRRNAHNIERTRRGRRSCGQSPYGYRTIPARYEGAVEVEPARVEVVPEEFAVAAEIFREALARGCQSIAWELNARAIPTSGAARREGYQAKQWTARTVQGILSNPFYAGYIVHRTEMRRERGQVALPRDRWVWADQPGDWPAVVTLDQWEEAQQAIAARRWRNPTASLVPCLTCARGRHMFRTNINYRCRCTSPDKRTGQRDPHPGSYVPSRIIEAYVRHIVDLALATLDPAELPEPDGRPRADLYAQVAQLERTLSEKRRQLDEMIRRAEWFLSLPEFGEERYRANLQTLSQEGATLEASIAELRNEATRPDPAETRAVLEHVRGMGEQLWAERPGWTTPDMRQLIGCIVRDVRLQPPSAPRQFLREVTVTLHPPFAGRVQIPPLCPPGRSIRYLSSPNSYGLRW